MLRALFSFSSATNALGGGALLMLVVTGVSTDPGHALPYVAIIVGGVLLAQGSYSFGYAMEWWRGWRSMATGALLAGQLISACIGILTIWYAIYVVPRAANGGVEPGPFFSGAAITVNAVLALAMIGTGGMFKPTTRGRAAA